ncbi:MAG TPA: TetR/AcrR family transcriptional regulator [Acidimicrobiales bacterium]|nr:TetR/AcrR family transcriptional regulator [Acidimicrobiales bacterium]
MAADGARREEILTTAAALFASSGLQTSLKEIADACGILPGSLYHHFDSKEAIVIELVQRYRDDLDRVAKEAVGDVRLPSSRPAAARIMELGRSIADCGVRHRAALLLTLYEPPAVLGDELVHLARQTPTEIESAMIEIVRQGRAAGEMRPGVDPALLAERLCQSMLHVGVGVSHLSPGAEQVPEMRLGILLRGIAASTPSNSALDRSEALRAVRHVIAGWDDDTHDDDDRTAHLRAVARREFGRRGYESTTMRDIAAAAGLSTGTVYRSFRSKDELLASIMSSYWENWTSAWGTAVRSASTPLEKLDALMWVNIQVIGRFSDEFKIQLAWLRQSPPSTPNLDFSFRTQLRQIKTLLAEGARAGEIHLDGASADVRARCVFEAIMTTPHIIEVAGSKAAHALARDTVLRGAISQTDALRSAVPDR